VKTALSLFYKIPFLHKFLHIDHGSINHINGGKKAFNTKIELSFIINPPSPLIFYNNTISTI
jgi:hypothetical protein